MSGPRSTFSLRINNRRMRPVNWLPANVRNLLAGQSNPSRTWKCCPGNSWHHRKDLKNVYYVTMESSFCWISFHICCLQKAMSSILMELISPSRLDKDSKIWQVMTPQSQLLLNVVLVFRCDGVFWHEASVQRKLWGRLEDHSLRKSNVSSPWNQKECLSSYPYVHRPSIVGAPV